MRITVKLYASLNRYLPAGAIGNEAQIEIEDGLTLDALLVRLRLPRELCHLVLLNGAFVPPHERSRVALHADDEVAVWPAVAGG